jgi:hypothetical protein
MPKGFEVRDTDGACAWAFQLRPLSAAFAALSNTHHWRNDPTQRHSTLVVKVGAISKKIRIRQAARLRQSRGRMDDNDELFRQILDDDDFKETLMGLYATSVYRRLRSE